MLTGWQDHPHAIQIEAGIFDLVLALNRTHHTRTEACCQGHQHIDYQGRAWVDFHCPLKVAAELIRIACHHKGFSVQIRNPNAASNPNAAPQSISTRIEVRNPWNPTRQAVPSRSLQSILDPFIADMETAGLLTEHVVPAIAPYVSWNREEGIFLPSAQIILDEAFQTATQLGHSYVDCEHLLYAVLRQLSPEEGKALPLFEMLHLSPEQLVQAVKADLEQLPCQETPSDQRWHSQAELVRDKVEATQPEGHPSLTRDAAEAIRRACMYVPERGQRNVSAYHLAHGICRYLLDESFRRDIYRQHFGWR